MDVESQFALAHTCTVLYKYHEKQCKEQIFTLLCDPQYNTSFILNYIKAVERRMSQPGWIYMKVALKIAQLNAQNSYEYPIKALCLYKMSNLPNVLDSTSVNALMLMNFYSKQAFSQQNVSFFGKFSNLTSLKFNDTTFDGDEISMVSKLSLLELISLYACKMGNGHLPKIFEGCTSLQEIQLSFCKFSDNTPIKPPSQVKRLKIEIDNVFELDVSDCTKLEHL